MPRTTSTASGAPAAPGARAGPSPRRARGRQERRGDPEADRQGHPGRSPSPASRPQALDFEGAAAPAGEARRPRRVPSRQRPAPRPRARQPERRPAHPPAEAGRADRRRAPIRAGRKPRRRRRDPPDAQRHAVPAARPGQPPRAAEVATRARRRRPRRARVRRSYAGISGARAAARRPRLKPVSSDDLRKREVGMKTIFVMVKCDLGKAYKVADETVQERRAGLRGLFDLRPIRSPDEMLPAGHRRYRPFRHRAGAGPCRGSRTPSRSSPSRRSRRTRTGERDNSREWR